MTVRPRVILASGSVTMIAAVNVTAVALGPGNMRLVVLLFGVLALIAAVQCATSDPALLAWALLFSLPPVIALLAEGAPTWLIGPLGALLLIAGELNTLSWEFHGTGTVDAVARRRLLNIGRLGAVGLVASLAIAVVTFGPSPGGTAAAIVAAAALAALVGVLFGRASSY